MLEVFAATEPLVIRVLDPALHHGFIGEVQGMLEIGGPTIRRVASRGVRVAIEAAELLIEALPVDEAASRNNAWR